MPRELPSQERLRQLFDYDADGFLKWKRRDRSEFKADNSHRVWNSKHAGKKAGWTWSGRDNPRHSICVDYKSYLAARLIWKWHHGTEPVMVDHRDCDTLNDRIENLRPADHSLNRANTRTRNRHGLKGVARSGKRFLAQMCRGGKAEVLGIYDTPEEAHAVYANRAREVFGEYVNLEPSAAP